MSKLIRIVYDKQCPACNQYCELTRRHTEKEVVFIDARNDSALMTEITNRGLDIDGGMVVEMDGALHYGADAIYVLATIGSSKGVFNIVHRVLFGNARVTRLLYPLLRGVRNLLLKMLSIGKINNLGEPGREK